MNTQKGKKKKKREMTASEEAEIIHQLIERGLPHREIKDLYISHKKAS